jgi:hypothetical protein
VEHDRRDWWATSGATSTLGGRREAKDDDSQLADVNVLLSSLAFKQGDMLFLSSTLPIDTVSTWIHSPPCMSLM